MAHFLKISVMTFIVLGLASCAPSFQSAGDQKYTPHISKTAVHTADGTMLRLLSWKTKSPDIILLGVHGFNDHGGAFTKAAEWFRAQNINTYAYDQRGFGQSKSRGIWASSEVLASDLRVIAGLLKKKHPGKPLYILGLSMGGAVTIKAATQDAHLPIDGVILAAPAIWGWKSMNPFYQGSLWMSAHTMPWYTATGEGLGKQASDNIPMLRALGKDPLFIKETRIDAVYGLVGLMDEANIAASELNYPSLYLYGEKDEIVPPKPSKKVMARMTGKQHRKVLYKNGWHMLLRDKQAQTVWADIVAWMKNREAILPSGEEITAIALAQDAKN